MTGNDVIVYILNSAMWFAAGAYLRSWKGYVDARKRQASR